MPGHNMKKKKEPLTPLKDIISDLFNSRDLPFDPDDAKIWEAWDEAVGPAIAEHAHPSWIKNGRLRVDVSDPIWMQELEFAKDRIKEKLNRRLGRNAVQRIEFRLGSG
jgi:predicted nucleic acid-binding Zn ribbon protein